MVLVPLVMERRTAGWYMHNFYYVKRKKKKKRKKIINLYFQGYAGTLILIEQKVI